MDMQKIGKFLAELRREKNLTQDELGEKIGVTNKTVSRWENGNYLPPVEMLQILSKFYDVSINEILNGERINDSDYKNISEENVKSRNCKSFVSNLFLSTHGNCCSIAINSSAYFNAISLFPCHIATRARVANKA